MARAAPATDGALPTKAVQKDDQPRPIHVAYHPARRGTPQVESGGGGSHPNTSPSETQHPAQRRRCPAGRTRTARQPDVARATAPARSRCSEKHADKARAPWALVELYVAVVLLILCLIGFVVGRARERGVAVFIGDSECPESCSRRHRGEPWSEKYDLLAQPQQSPTWLPLKPSAVRATRFPGSGWRSPWRPANRCRKARPHRHPGVVDRRVEKWGRRRSCAAGSL